MLPSITKKYDDQSTSGYYQFSFHCDECGAIWQSEQYPFSLRDSPPVSPAEKKAHEIIWMAEHDTAYERANIDAMLHFNKCSRCGKRVCDKCYSELEPVCLNCLVEAKKRLQEDNQKSFHFKEK